MSEILELAESDGVLDFWLNEADHFLAHELNLTNKESIYKFENQLANLREHLEHQLIENEKLDLFEELRHHLKHASQELQEHLKNRGFDPGPIDGILGPRTHSALIAFQQANQLIPNGLPDAVTREALGLK
ncbi:peptidoglycan-binding protein [Oscillatoria sp. FACHB-1407]|nr:peptidoglycan-binding protein [Oscillatoria sp. FACHB-1407]